MSNLAERQLSFYVPEKVRTDRVLTFLISKSRNSNQTAKSYGNHLLRLNNFLALNYPSHTVDSIIEALNAKKASKKIDVYQFLDVFTGELSRKYGAGSVNLTVSAVKSYLQYYDVEINQYKFRHKVTLPQIRKEDEVAIDPADARKILLSITKPRMKSYCMDLACKGARAVEGLALRAKDLALDFKPVKVYMRAEFAKNKLPREIYVSEEDISELSRFVKIEHGYTIEQLQKEHPDRLLFPAWSESPQSMYSHFAHEFQKTLDSIGMSAKKEGSNRHQITLHSFRRLVDTVVEDNTTKSFSEYILGHKKSVYYTKKEPERRQLWAQKCEQALTYLDYSAIDKKEKTIEKDNAALWKQIEDMKEIIKDFRKRLEEKV